jgi:hypothetical protein
MAGGGAPLALLGWRAQSPHFWPTGVVTMQRGQIGLPQLEHVSLVSTPGWLMQVGVMLVWSAVIASSCPY